MPIDSLDRLSPTERRVLLDLADGMGYSDAGGRSSSGGARRGVSHRMREKMGARTNAHAVAIAYRDGLLEPGLPDTWGVLAMLSVRYACHHPNMLAAVVTAMKAHPTPPPAAARQIAADVRRALEEGQDGRISYTASLYLQEIARMCDRSAADGE